MDHCKDGRRCAADVTWEQVRSNMVVAFYQSNPDQRGVTRKVSTICAEASWPNGVRRPPRKF